MNKQKKTLDKKTIHDITCQVLFCIKARPSAAIGPALGFGIAESIEEAVRLYVSEHWHEHADEYPESSMQIFQLAGKIGLFINETLTNYYGDYSWQHVPEYPNI